MVLPLVPLPESYIAAGFVVIGVRHREYKHPTRFGIARVAAGALDLTRVVTQVGMTRRADEDGRKGVTGFEQCHMGQNSLGPGVREATTGKQMPVWSKRHR